MRNFGIFNTTFSQSASYKKQVEEALKFVSENPGQCFADEGLKSFILNKTYSSFHTAMSQLFNHLIDAYKSKNSLPFVEMFITAKNPPEIFTYDSFSFNFEDITKSLPDKLKGTVVNLTNSIKYKPGPYGSSYQTEDLTKIYSLYVRAALCQSYANSADKLWLTPRLAIFLIKTYSMIITKQVGVYYHIQDPLLLKKLNFINTIFYANLLDKETESGYSDLIFRANIGNASEVNSMLSELNDAGFTFDRRYNITDLCEMYRAVGGDKLKTFDLIKLFKFFSAGSVDKAYSGICLEYPPYWAHQLLFIGSGGKHPVFYNIFRDGKILAEMPGFVQELNTTPTFIGSLG